MRTVEGRERPPQDDRAADPGALDAAVLPTTPTSPIGPARGWVARLSDRAYGAAFLLVVGLLMALCVASYAKVFTRSVDVTLLTDRIGSQLQTSADVKLRGLIVGEVRGISTTGRGARLQLALDPSTVDLIPADVSARLLPKTLFGERFVDLVPPEHPSGRHLEPGDTIEQDRTSVAIELEKVFDDLLPLLRTVRPDRLATTLNALASALEGRGTRLGQNLVLVDDYFKVLNPTMPVIKADISGLADLASTYAVAAPDLVRAATNLITTNTTIVTKKDQLAGFLAGTAGFANTTADFLDANGDRIIRVGKVGRPTMELFAKYSPQYPCFTQALVDWRPRIDDAFRDRRFHITVELSSSQRPGYVPGEEPRWGEHRPAACNLLPDPHDRFGHPTSQEYPVPGKKFDDGTHNVGGYSSNPSYSALPQMFAGAAGAAIPDPDAGLAGTVQEQQLVTALLQPDAASPSAITTLLAGPMLRGSTVDQR
ncbi:MCE family protein [Pedococcus sp. NPDC057267]|uniref:MCE family protein n=1 Tax=Pedococcus sp. NPDC057267 TaxID=3346077 RepID=UPI00362708E9